MIYVKILEHVAKYVKSDDITCKYGDNNIHLIMIDYDINVTHPMGGTHIDSLVSVYCDCIG